MKEHKINPWSLVGPKEERKLPEEELVSPLSTA